LDEINKYLKKKALLQQDGEQNIFDKNQESTYKKSIFYYKGTLSGPD